MKKPLVAFLALSCLFISGCALNEIARKEDIVAAKSDLSEDILALKNQNLAMSENLQSVSQRVEELEDQIQSAKSQTADSVAFVQERMGTLETQLQGAKQDQQKISSEFAQKIQVVLDEVDKENTKLLQKIDTLGKTRSASTNAASRPSPKPGPGQKLYTVVAGDSMAKIAKKHGVSVEKLLAMNKLQNPNALQAGQRILVPADSE